MNILILLTLFVTVFAYKDISESEHYEKVLSKPEELKKQLLCYLEKGPCSDMGEHHKRHLIELVNDGCAECTPNHKHNVRLFIRAAKVQFPDLFAELRHKYDPEGKHYDHLLEEVVQS